MDNLPVLVSSGTLVDHRTANLNASLHVSSASEEHPVIIIPLGHSDMLMCFHISADCPQHLACVQEKCRDPCVSACGFNAECRVFNHNPQCTCLPGYTGDPFSGCSLIPQVIEPVRVEEINPCNPSPCGANAVCKERNGAGSCTCLPEYFGDPYTGCRPECVINSDCSQDKACVRNKCVSPCPGVCGYNAECNVINHIPVCTCAPGYTGDAFRGCHQIRKYLSFKF